MSLQPTRDWTQHGDYVFIHCPDCGAAVPAMCADLDKDGCVYLRCCGGQVVQLIGWAVIEAVKPTQ